MFTQGSGRRGDQTVCQSTGGPGQTGTDRGVHHSPAQLVTVPHVQPRVHAGQGLLHIQRHAQATGPVPDASRPRLQAYAQPRGFRYGYVYQQINKACFGRNQHSHRVATKTIRYERKT